MSEESRITPSRLELETAFLDVERVFQYGNIITPISLHGKPFPRV